MKKKISRVKILSFILIVEGSAAFAYLFHSKYHDNSNAITVVTAAFSILAGFLIAVLGIGWDERIVRSRSWRASVVELELIKEDMGKHKAMFYLYLFILVLAFFSSLNFDIRWIDNSLDFLVIFFSCIALVYSFRLPGYLMRKNMSELDRIIRQRQDRETSERSTSERSDNP